MTLFQKLFSHAWERALEQNLRVHDLRSGSATSMCDLREGRFISRGLSFSTRVPDLVKCAVASLCPPYRGCAGRPTERASKPWAGPAHPGAARAGSH